MIPRPTRKPPLNSHLDSLFQLPPGRPLIVAGPTGVGKTAFAVALAERLGAEILGADAFQIYREIPVLTAQPTPAQRTTVPHHLVGFHPVADPFDVATYAEMATATLADLASRQRPAIIVGGTGLYLRALTEGLADLPPSDPTLRAELNALPLPELLARLRAADPAAPDLIDLQNPRRVVRAVEICELSGRPLADFRTPVRTKPTHGILLHRDRAELHARIAANVHAMFEAGVTDEVEELTDIGPTAARTLGLRTIQNHLAGTLSRADAIDEITLATRQFAKRQLTWFRNQTSLQLLDLTGTPHPSGALDSALRLLSAS